MNAKTDSPNERFQGTINKTLTDERGNRFVQVQHHDTLYRVYSALTEAELQIVKAFDDQYFKGTQQVSLADLRSIRDFGRVLMLRDGQSGPLLGMTQILLSSIHRQEVRRGEAFSYGTAGKGYGQILYKAQEVVAREAGKEKIRCTVRVENTITIRALMYAGFRIREYDPTRYGALELGGGRLVLEKDLIDETVPFQPDRQAGWVADGNVLIVDRPESAESVMMDKPYAVGVPVWNEDRLVLSSHLAIQRVMAGGYIGVALLKPGEIGEAEGPRKLLVFQREDESPRSERLSMPVRVHSEFARLREVVVSFTPENAQIKAEYAINEVARRNVNNIDPIAFKDEYNLFVGTLVDQGVRVVHTNAIGREGKSAIFTRDPAYAIGDSLVIGRLGQAQRHYETDGMRQVGLGRRVVELSEDEQAVTEGGDIIFIGEKRLAVGIGQRTNKAGLLKLQETFPDYEFIAVPHTDLHLDVLFTMLGSQKALADVTRLPANFLALLKNDGFTIVEADPAEQVSLGCNVVAIAENVVLAAKENSSTNARLKAAGVTVIEVSMPNIVKWGGGPRCMTCPTFRE